MIKYHEIARGDRVVVAKIEDGEKRFSVGDIATVVSKSPEFALCDFGGSGGHRWRVSLRHLNYG